MYKVHICLTRGHHKLVFLRHWSDRDCCKSSDTYLGCKSHTKVALHTIKTGNPVSWQASTSICILSPKQNFYLRDLT